MANPLDPQATVLERCGEIGLDSTMARDTRHTLSARPAPKSSRELPRISVDLSRTIPMQEQKSAPPANHRIERDLEVLGLLGEGGMGRVLLARQHSLDREVAIKTLHRRASDKERAALLSEGAITGHLEHPTIIPVHALGIDPDGNPLLVMKRVEGVEWSALIDDAAHQAWGAPARDRLDAHLDIFMQVANAVDFAHGRSVVHRDIKPQNVLIGRHGEVYLGDWGLAVRIDRDWEPQPLCGTPAYMAPEMVVGGAVDARTDVYLLGATLHHVLTGQPRNQGASAREALRGAIEQQPIAYPPSVPEELGAIANRATARDPGERFASARELRQAVADYLQHRASIVLAQSAIERVGQIRSLVGGAIGDPGVSEEFDRLAVESRFALEQALREWSGNRAASAALDELQALLAERRARAAELERRARDMDPRVSQKQRTAATVLLTAVVLFLTGLAIVQGEAELTARALLGQSLAPLAVLLVALAFFGREVFSNTFNRGLSVMTMVLIGSICLSRALGIWAGESVPQLLLHDCVSATVGLAIGGAVLMRFMWWPAAVMAAASVLVAAFPGHALITFSIGVALSVIANAWRLATR